MDKYFFFLLAVVFSCTSKNSKSPEFKSGELTDYIIDTLYFEKDEFTKTLPVKFAYLEKNDNSFLYAWSDKRLLKYAYPSGKLISSTNFFVEGPDGIGSFISGSLITEDGLFFISDQKAVVHADFEGKVIARFPLPVVPEERLGANYSAMNGNEMSYDPSSKVLILADVPFVLKEPNMSYSKWLWKLDIKSEEFKAISFSYPEKYREHYDDTELGLYSFTYLQDKDHFVINFPVHDSLMVLAPDKSFWVEAKSTQALVFEKGRTETNGEWIAFLASMETSRYKWTQYDPYKKKLLRYVNIQTKESEIETYTNESSFVVLDQELRKVAELFFDNRKISPSGFFTPSGFYLKLGEQESDDREGYVKVAIN